MQNSFDQTVNPSGEIEIQKTDIPIGVKYRSVPINGSIELYNGGMKITIDGDAIIGIGRVYCGLNGKPEIYFEMQCYTATPMLGIEGVLTLHICQIQLLWIV